MNVLQLFQKAQTTVLTEEERNWLSEQTKRYPYFAVFRFMLAKEGRSTPGGERLKTIAGVFAPDRNKYADFLRNAPRGLVKIVDMTTTSSTSASRPDLESLPDAHSAAGVLDLNLVLEAPRAFPINVPVHDAFTIGEAEAHFFETLSVEAENRARDAQPPVEPPRTLIEEFPFLPNDERTNDFTEDVYSENASSDTDFFINQETLEADKQVDNFNNRENNIIVTEDNIIITPDELEDVSYYDWRLNTIINVRTDFYISLIPTLKNEIDAYKTLYYHKETGNIINTKEIPPFETESQVAVDFAPDPVTVVIRLEPENIEPTSIPKPVENAFDYPGVSVAMDDLDDRNEYVDSDSNIFERTFNVEDAEPEIEGLGQENLSISLPEIEVTDLIISETHSSPNDYAESQTIYSSNTNAIEENLPEIKNESVAPSSPSGVETPSFAKTEEPVGELPGRITSPSMTRFIEPTFDRTLSDFTSRSERAAKVEISEIPIVTPPPTPPIIPSIKAERITSDSMRRFVEPTFDGRPETFLPIGFSESIEAENVPKRSDETKRAPKQKEPPQEIDVETVKVFVRDVPGESISLQNRITSDSMRRFVEPEFDVKPATLYVPKEDDEPETRPILRGTPPDSDLPPPTPPVKAERITSDSMRRFVEPEFDTRINEEIFAEMTPQTAVEPPTLETELRKESESVKVTREREHVEIVPEVWTPTQVSDVEKSTPERPAESGGGSLEINVEGAGIKRIVSSSMLRFIEPEFSTRAPSDFDAPQESKRILPQADESIAPTPVIQLPKRQVGAFTPIIISSISAPPIQLAKEDGGKAEELRKAAAAFRAGISEEEAKNFKAEKITSESFQRFVSPNFETTRAATRTSVVDFKGSDDEIKPSVQPRPNIESAPPVDKADRVAPSIAKEEPIKTEEKAAIEAPVEKNILPVVETTPLTPEPYEPPRYAYLRDSIEIYISPTLLKFFKQKPEGERQTLPAPSIQIIEPRQETAFVSEVIDLSTIKTPETPDLVVSQGLTVSFISPDIESTAVINVSPKIEPKKEVFTQKEPEISQIIPPVLVENTDKEAKDANVNVPNETLKFENIAIVSDVFTPEREIKTQQPEVLPIELETPPLLETVHTPGPNMRLRSIETDPLPMDEITTSLLDESGDVYGELARKVAEISIDLNFEFKLEFHKKVVEKEKEEIKFTPTVAGLPLVNEPAPKPGPFVLPESKPEAKEFTAFEPQTKSEAKEFTAFEPQAKPEAKEFTAFEPQNQETAPVPQTDIVTGEASELDEHAFVIDNLRPTAKRWEAAPEASDFALPTPGRDISARRRFSEIGSLLEKEKKKLQNMFRPEHILEQLLEDKMDLAEQVGTNPLGTGGFSVSDLSNEIIEDLRHARRLGLIDQSIEAAAGGANIYAKVADTEENTEDANSILESEWFAFDESKRDRQNSSLKEKLEKIRAKSIPTPAEVSLRKIQQKYLNAIVSTGKAAQKSILLTEPEPEVENFDLTAPQPGVSFTDSKIESALKRLEEFESRFYGHGPPTGVSAEPEVTEEESEEIDLKYATEKQADLFAKQGAHEMAIKIFERLKLKFPEKIGYFDGKISALSTQ